MDIRHIRWPAEQEALAEHIQQVHGPDDRDLLMHWYGNFPGYDPADCFVIEGDEGQIAAHTMLIPRQIQIGQTVLPAAEIGVVGTLEPYRGRGYASALMDRALARMTERGDALGLILGIPNFYERWDYEYAAGLYLTSFESDIVTDNALKAGTWSQTHSYQRRMASYLGAHGARNIKVRRYTARDLPAVMPLYQKASARGHYMMARDRVTWEWQLRFMMDIGRYDRDDFLVAERDGEILAYVRVVSSGPVNWFRGDEAARFSVIESAGDDPDAIEALLAAVGQMAVDYAADRIAFFVHPESRMMRHMLAHGGAQRQFTGGAFLRLHSLALTLELLQPTLAARLDGSVFAGRALTLELATADHVAALEFNGGGEPVQLEAPAVDILRLITGWFTVDDLLPDYYSEPQRALLRVLFPKRDPRLGMADFL